MAIRRVRSKIGPTYESIASDEEIERWPDMWEVLDGEPNISALLNASAGLPAPVPAVSRAETAADASDTDESQSFR